MRRSFALLSLILSFNVSSYGQNKRRVAVLNFDYSTVSSSVAQIWGSSNNDVGKGIADLLVEKLVTDGVYSVIDRKMIDKVMAEQNFSNSDRADPNSAAKVGRILGVDAIVVGSITQFGRDDHQTNVGGNVLGGVAGRYGLGGVGKKSSKAVVAVTARLISTDTAEILAVANGKGESSRSGTALLGSGGSAINNAGGVFDMSSSNFAATLLGEAVNSAVTGLAKQLDANAQALPTRTVNVDGLVADATNGIIVLNVGAKGGVKVGDVLHIKRTGREIKDPATGRVIRRDEKKLGDVTITEVDDLSAVGKFSGGENPKVGDVVSSKP
jgi:curli biogenesis system outer membrane secretion channel CsgG